jgi:hypothetical protein
MRNVLILTICFICGLVFAASAFSQEETRYKSFKSDDHSCYVGILYRQTAEGSSIGVSAVATGKGAEFRKWVISKIKLSVAGEKIRPDREAEFYVKKESFFRVPAAVLFAVLGAGVDVGGSGLEQGITKVGMAAALGILALQAKGEITGENVGFDLTKEMVDSIASGKDYVEITVENNDIHTTDTIKIGIAKPEFGPAKDYGFAKMSGPDLVGALATLDGRLSSLETEQATYQYGTDPEYDRIQQEIEDLETRRGTAYRAWLEK